MVEKKSRKLQMGMVPFSPSLDTNRKCISLWSAIFKKKIGYEMNLGRTLKLWNSVGVSNPMDTSLDEATINFVLAKQTRYDQIKRNATEMRNVFLEQKVLAILKSTRGGGRNAIYKSLFSLQLLRNIVSS